ETLREVEMGETPLDPGPIPSGAVLILEKDRCPRGTETGRAAGVGEEAQGGQTLDLRLQRHEPGEHLGEPDRLVAEIDPDEILPGHWGVALVEDQTDHGQDRLETLGQVR